MKAVIIEDETTAVNSLKAILAQNTVTQIEVIAELESIEESVDFFRTSPHPDIIFMDIHLADGGWIGSIDYLLKPDAGLVERALNKLRRSRYSSRWR